MNRASSSKLLLAAGLAAFAAAACQTVATAQEPVAPPPAAPSPSAEWKGKNLQVLPADMPRSQVIGVMKKFSAALGVECSFCHANGADGKLDPSLDTNEHKASARWMMKMVAGLNEQFHVKPGEAPEVTCYTCHRGSAHPATTLPPEPPKPQS